MVVSVLLARIRANTANPAIKEEIKNTELMQLSMENTRKATANTTLKQETKKKQIPRSK